ncbi:MAG: AsmA family protein, partial [Bacteroidales bacterium]|nr:AsmA family protein [Bacteroidales bacterium]
MKKGLKITGAMMGSFLVLIVAAGLLLPVIFKDRIRERVETGINKMVDARVSFSGYKLSLFRSFPNAAFTLYDLQVTGIDEFSDDTLASVESF